MTAAEQRDRPGTPGPLVARLVAGPGRAERVRHVETVPARAGSPVPWPAWADPVVVLAAQASGVDAPWAHQAATAEHLRAGRHVAVATGTASGKSLAYQLPLLTGVREGASAVSGRGVTALYLAPTKALAADQLAGIGRLDVPGIRAATYDGDTSRDERCWVRRHANVVLTNPDLLHHSLLPGHEHWAPFLRSLRFVVVDESHHYRGVFGSHVAAVLRRLRRVAARYRSAPVFVFASATTADPAATARLLAGVDAATVTVDASPRGRMDVVLWEPPLLTGGDGHGAPTRRPAATETADLLTDLVAAGVPTLAFVPSRRGAESVAATARRRLDEAVPGLGDRVAAYRGGYLPEERRELEAALRTGRLLGLAATNALELGIDVSGLDAVLVCGWPGRLSSLWQQVGRAGRRRRDAVAVLVARDDPLDTYLVHHPGAVFDRPIDATVLDPGNPVVLAPHLCAAAAELPITVGDLDLFGPGTADLLDALTARGYLRRRPTGWYWTRPDRASGLADLRGAGGDPVRIVDAATGRILGTVDAGAAHHAVHEGAVHLHQGDPWLVRDLDLDGAVATVEPADGTVATHARDRVDIRVLGEREQRDWGPVWLHLGTVEVTSQVVSFVRRDVASGAALGEEPLDLPPRSLRTSAVWWTMPPGMLASAGVHADAVPGSAHAAEHAAIGLLPLVAACDRWDVGGVSTALHPDTGLPTIFVHDGHPGGTGFAERGFRCAATWLTATRDAVAGCACVRGCPSCVHSPKCGNGNSPLDKPGALRLLDAVLAGAVPDAGRTTGRPWR